VGLRKVGLKESKVWPKGAGLKVCPNGIESRTLVESEMLNPFRVCSECFLAQLAHVLWAAG